MALFEPIKIGNHQLQHRVVLAPMTRSRNDEKHAPTDLLVEFYSQRATPGGLLISEGILISPGAGSFPAFPGIYTEDQINAWRKVTDAVHAKGGIFFAQITHAGRFGSARLNPGNVPPVGPSPIAASGTNIFVPPFGKVPFEVPRELTKDEIMEIVQEYVKAAQNAIKAGFDGVELHGANSMLINQFISSTSNVRTDEYGGSIENRTRFAQQVEQYVSKAIGSERVGFRFSPWVDQGDVNDETPYETWGYILKKLNPKLAYVHFVEPRDDYINTIPDLENSLDPFRKIWKGPFISAGGYSNKIDLMKSVVEETGNLIALGRAFTANPDLVERLKNGWPLNKYNRDTFYTTGPTGYIDYPFYIEM
ncbi:hypothetical protein BJV82DRAFT_605600 [Fennellomyces sp. T-0311]|nr:hypothetical protein BJV82DRAFT_605600 [Fennellomyces sp. T-0311]